MEDKKNSVRSDFTGASSISGGASDVIVVTEDVCGNVWTAAGNASLDSSVKKFGAASAHFPSGAYISATDVLHLSAEKWTFDAWLYLVSTTSSHGYFGLGTASSGQAGIHVTPSNVHIANESGSNWATQISLSTLGWDAANTWMHVAIVKDSSSASDYD